MKNLGLILALLFIVSCAPVKGNDGEGCTVSKSNGVSTISCPDGTTSTVTDGANGHSMVFDTVAADTSQCPNGGTIIVMGVDMNDNGLLDVALDSNIQSAKTCNGSNGTSPTPSPFSTVKLITPCGPNSSPYKEVLLVLYDGSLLASFSERVSGKNTRLAIIPDGTYRDTDDSACVFTVSTSGHTRSVSWFGGGDSWQIH